MTTNETALVVRPPSVREVETLAHHFAESGFFADSKGLSQAVTKILAGQELGIGPVTALTGIYIVKGRVTLSANLIAASIKRGGKYNYRVKELTDERCVIAFFEGKEAVGESAFSMADAKRAELANGDNWKKYPRNMLFARAISNGAKVFTPDIFGGAVYTPDELGESVDGETGEVIEHTPSGPVNTKTGEIIDSRPAPSAAVINEAQRKRMFAIAKEAGVSHEQIKDHIKRAYSKSSTTALTPAEYDAVCAWIESQKAGPAATTVDENPFDGDSPYIGDPPPAHAPRPEPKKTMSRAEQEAEFLRYAVDVLKYKDKQAVFGALNVSSLDGVELIGAGKTLREMA